MRRTEFVAVGCRDLAACRAALEGEGWTSQEAQNDLLVAVGVEGRVREFRHPRAPYPLLVAEGAEGLRATAVARGGGRGYVWIELIVDGDYQVEQLAGSAVLREIVERVASGELRVPEGFDGVGLS